MALFGGEGIMASKEYSKQYYEKNRERMIQKSTEYAKNRRANDPEFRERELERNRLWRKNNPDKVQASRDKWIENNLEKYRASTRASSKRAHIKNQHTPEGVVTDLFHRVNRSAKKRGLENTVTREILEDLIIKSNGVCAISGKPLSTIHRDPSKLSVDRIDSNTGYVKGNIRLVTTIANLMKNDMTDEELLDMAKCILKTNGYSVRKK